MAKSNIPISTRRLVLKERVQALEAQVSELQQVLTVTVQQVLQILEHQTDDTTALDSFRPEDETSPGSK